MRMKTPRKSGAAENFGAVIGFAAGAALAMKEKLDEQSAREEQQQAMGGF